MKLKKENFKKWKNIKKNSFGSIFLLRPLIETTRFDLKKLCQIWSLPIYPDVTNQSLVSTRNRIRLQLLPILRFFFNSQVDTIFAQFTQINLQEQDFLNYLTTRLIKDLFSKKKISQNKTLNSFENFFSRQKPSFYKTKVKPHKVGFHSSFLPSKNQLLRNQTSFHFLYKFEFQNQPLFFIPPAIQKKIGKKLIESFLNKKVNFFHVEYLMKYLKDSQNLV